MIASLMLAAALFAAQDGPEPRLALTGFSDSGVMFTDLASAREEGDLVRLRLLLVRAEPGPVGDNGQEGYLEWTHVGINCESSEIHDFGYVAMDAAGAELVDDRLEQSRQSIVIAPEMIFERARLQVCQGEHTGDTFTRDEAVRIGRALINGGYNG